VYNATNVYQRVLYVLSDTYQSLDLLSKFP